MQLAVTELFDPNAGYVATRELLSVMTRQQLDVRVRRGELIRVWHGVYARHPPDYFGRLAALDVYLGQRAVACLGTAAWLYGFDTEAISAVHVLDPGRRVRPAIGLMVHQRLGAPLNIVQGRLATAPAWTAVEVARQLKRPRALATLDAALHSGLCGPADLVKAVREQWGRRGIVAVRSLLPFADGRAESALESEARLAMLDRGVPVPELQYVIEGDEGQRWRVDFAWPDYGVAAEYESIEWHAGREEMLRDKERFAGIQRTGWTVIPIIVTDVRLRPELMADRLLAHLARGGYTG
ncbi:hypothetical protein [Mycobacterium sp. SMC-4]|uniref:hypothetical protein n=1 Tax=Mycobacterium sp. SMC-4 TaxID=2857059 RepID=UPI003CFF5EE8